jgi:hypothetical protein
VNSGANERAWPPNPRSPCAFGSSSPQSEEMSEFRAIHARSVVCLTTCLEPHNGIARGRSCSWDNGEDCLSTFGTLPPQHVTLALFISIILTDPAPHAPFVSAISVASPRSQPSTGSKRAVSRMANSPSPRSCAAVMSRTCIQRGESNGFSCRCAPVVDRPQQGQSSRQLI